MRVLLKINDADALALLEEVRRAASQGGERWAIVHKHHTRIKYRLEFPTGELAQVNPDLQGAFFAAKALGQAEIGLPITGKEHFDAQGLEGKCYLEGYGTQLLVVYDTLPQRRRIIYRVTEK